jgi:hypothetical protein
MIDCSQVYICMFVPLCLLAFVYVSLYSEYRISVIILSLISYAFSSQVMMTHMHAVHYVYVAVIIDKADRQTTCVHLNDLSQAHRSVCVWVSARCHLCSQIYFMIIIELDFKRCSSSRLEQVMNWPLLAVSFAYTSCSLLSVITVKLLKCEEDTARISRSESRSVT